MCGIITKCQWNLSTSTHMKLWKESGIKEESSLILGYSSSQVARKSSSPVSASAIFQNIEIRLVSARAYATSFHSVN